jgi:hypothetical protein
VELIFGVRRPQDLEAELIVSGGAVIHVKSRQGVDPYLEIHMCRSMKGWQKKWFYLRNDASALLRSLHSLVAARFPCLPWEME